VRAQDDAGVERLPSHARTVLFDNVAVDEKRRSGQVRKIIHIDMDAFYASVEQRDRPELRGRPVIVGWPGERSVVCAASYEARRFGVHSAMPASRARRLCPSGVFIAPNFEQYTAVSRQIRTIFERHTPLVEPLSLDEAYLDVTIELTGIPSATEAAQAIRREILEETRLTASAGVAPNKFLAKIASDWKKPDGCFVIRPEQVEAFLESLPVRRIPGVGKATEKVMTEIGVATVGDLRRFSEAELVGRFGKWGARLWQLARGIDESPVQPSRKRKSWSNENTFPHDLTLDEVAAHIRDQARSLWEAMAKRNVAGRTVTVKLRTGQFETATRRVTPELPPASGDELANIGVELLGRFDFPAGRRFRLAGIGVSNFIDETDDQPALFG